MNQIDVTRVRSGRVEACAHFCHVNYYHSKMEEVEIVSLNYIIPSSPHHLAPESQPPEYRAFRYWDARFAGQLTSDLPVGKAVSNPQLDCTFLKAVLFDLVVLAHMRLQFRETSPPSIRGGSTVSRSSVFLIVTTSPRCPEPKSGDWDAFRAAARRARSRLFKVSTWPRNSSTGSVFIRISSRELVLEGSERKWISSLTLFVGRSLRPFRVSNSCSRFWFCSCHHL